MNHPHPSRDDFVAWLTGGMDSDQIHAIETHVDQCPTCRTELDSIDKSCNSMQRQVRNAYQATIIEDEPPEVNLQGLMPTIDSGIAVDDSGGHDSRNDEQATIRTVSQVSAESDTSANWDQSVRPSVESEQSIPKSFGRYMIERVLGRGGMGAVYLATDSQLDRKVALKIPKFAHKDGVKRQQTLERFYREAKASATLRSPNICPVYDVGDIDGQHYITMAYIEGRPLSEFTKSKKKHSEEQIATTIFKIAMGLQKAHDVGVIHRDLKPANIMMDLHGEPVVMDFGLARRSDSDDVQMTQSGDILGTPAYMAPEQVAGDQLAINHRCDIYALGVVMYELITGQMPFKGNLLSILSQISKNSPKPPSEIRENLDSRLEAICRKMMAGEQTKRYQSMQDVAKDLKIVLRDPKNAQERQAENETPRLIPIPTAEEESQPALITIDPSESFPQSKPTSRRNRKRDATRHEDAEVAASQRFGNGRGQLPPIAWIAGGLGGFSLLLFGFIFSFRIGKHDVQITLDDPSIQLSVDGELVKIQDGNDIYRLAAGEHRLELRKDGLQTHVEAFTVTKNGKTAIHAAIVGGELDGLINGEQPTRTKTKPTVPAIAPSKQLIPNAASRQTSKLRVLTPEAPQPTSAMGSVDPAFAKSLRFSHADDEVSFPTLRDHTGALTMEVWMRRDPRNLQPHSMILTFDSVSGIVAESHSMLDFFVSSNIEDPGRERTRDWGQIGVSSPVHVAGVRDPINQEIRTYIDGKLVKTFACTFKRGNSHLEIGSNEFQWQPSDASGDHSFWGWIYEIRVSDLVRYAEDFQPEPVFGTDDHTLALYHVDEGSGDVLHDASGNGHDGKISGATWATRW